MYDNLDPYDVSEKLKQSIARKEMIIIVGLLDAHYEGRASSRIGPGERLVLIKSDHSVIVHRPVNYEPVNWQPPNSKIEVKVPDGKLVIEARRVRPSEILVIRFDKIYHYSSFKLTDEAEFLMHATEEEMKKAIILCPQLVEEGFKPVEDERRVHPSGFIDILGVDSSGRLVVVEIKRKTITAEDVRQLARYVEKIGEELGRRPRGIIVGPGIQRTASRELTLHGVEYKCVTPMKCLEVLRRSRGLDRFIR